MLSLFSNLPGLLAFAAALVLAISVHEFAHAWVADRLGDPTPRQNGRVTLNPLAHLDPIGSLMLLVVGFGWGRPVIINPRNFSQPAWDELLVALAGPASNAILAALAGFAARSFAVDSLSFALIFLFIQINVLLLLFNLIPVPPLDGSKILRPLLGEEGMRSLELISLPLILGLLLVLQVTPAGELLSSLTATMTAFFIQR